MPRAQEPSISGGLKTKAAASKPLPDAPDSPSRTLAKSIPTALTLASAPPRLFVGTSGWAYPSWKPGFYPEGLSAKKFLSFYAGQLNSVEVNYTFQRLPSAAILRGWLDATPPGFRLTFKAPQRITHFNRLRDCHDLVGEFVASIEPARLADKLGLVLFQLPPNFKADLDRLSTFLAAPALQTASAPRIAFEFRHESWFAEPTLSQLDVLLAEHHTALCIAETADFRSPEIHPAATHTSFRLRHSGGYTPAELDQFAERFLSLTNDRNHSRDVYVYFKHEDEPTGALNAVAMLHQALFLDSAANRSSSRKETT